MNLRYINPFENDFPDHISGKLEQGVGRICSFNRRGTLLAVGCVVGKVVIWDFETLGVAKELTYHTAPITGVSWSRNGCKLFTTSMDGRAVLWNVLKGTAIRKLHFEVPVIHSTLHPRNPRFCTIALKGLEPYVYDLSAKQVKRKQLLLKPAHQKKVPKSKTKLRKPATNMFAVFDRRGKHIFTGSSRGTITVHRLDSHLTIVKSVKAGNAIVKKIVFSKDNKLFLSNSGDRVIRVFDGETFEFLREFQDVVNRLQWVSAGFSAMADYLVSATSLRATHNLYIWNCQFGRLIGILEGPKETVLDLQWHPHRPIIVTCTSSGAVYIWTKQLTANWAVFAPDFEVLEENVQYVESSTTSSDIEETAKRHAEQQEQIEKEPVDILTCDAIPMLSDDEDDGCEEMDKLSNELTHLPTIVPEQEVIIRIPQDVLKVISAQKLQTPLDGPSSKKQCLGPAEV